MSKFNNNYTLDQETWDLFLLDQIRKGRYERGIKSKSNNKEYKVMSIEVEDNDDGWDNEWLDD